MKEKYGNKSPLMRFIHKNTGFLVCFGILAVAVPWYFYETNSQEFFEGWSCDRLQTYVLLYNQDIYKENFPDHEHLSEEQHMRFHEVIGECDSVFKHE